VSLFIILNRKMYKYWIYYYLFIKRVYRKRWRDVNSSVWALAFGTLVVHTLFLITIIDYIAGANMVSRAVSGDAPLAPLGLALAYIIIPILLNFSRRNTNSYGVKRKAIITASMVSPWVPILFLAISSLLFILTIMLIIAQI